MVKVMVRGSLDKVGIYRREPTAVDTIDSKPLVSPIASSHTFNSLSQAFQECYLHKPIISRPTLSLRNGHQTGDRFDRFVTLKFEVKTLDLRRVGPSNLRRFRWFQYITVV